MNEELDAGGTGEDGGNVQADQHIVDEAMADGWKPKEQFHGPEDQWVDAETFVKRGREINPILRKNNERLQREIADLRQKLDGTTTSLQRVQEYHAKLETRAYERALKDLKAQKKVARAEGDNEAVDAIEDEIEELQQQKPEPVKPAESVVPKVDPILAEWMEEEKSWFNNQNQEMMDYANAVGIRLRREDPSNSRVGRAFLDEITKAVKKQFPEKFGSRRASPSAVAGGGDTTTGRSRSNGSTTLADLPPDARAACKELSREQWYIDLAKSQKMTPEQLYIQDYQL